MDIVDKDMLVWEFSSYGMKVFFIMVVNQLEVLVGIVLDVIYVCIKIEDIWGEYCIEECYWVAGFEYVDSFGVDVMNFFLGYIQFDEAFMNYIVKDLIGSIFVVSQVVNIVVWKGMLVVISVGNEGSSFWCWIGILVDVVGVFLIGVIVLNGDLASFSLVGLIVDWCIKLDIVVFGVWVILVDVY